MFQIDNKKVKAYENKLYDLNHRAIPFATRSTLNTLAFTGQKEAREIVGEKMITRNAYSQQSIRVETTKELRITQQRAILGSVADYMATQEFGGVSAKRGRRGKPIATSTASGEGEGTSPRRKLPRRSNALRNIQLRNKAKRGKNRKQKNLIAIREAVSTGKRFVFLDLGRKQGIFRVKGGTKKRPDRAELKMLHDMSNDAVTIPRNPWLAPAVERLEPQLPRIYANALRFQLKRLK